MPTARCPQCRKKIDTSYYGSCIDCGILLSEVSVSDTGVPSDLAPTPRHPPEDSTPMLPVADEHPGAVAAAPGTSSSSIAGRIATGIGGGLLVRLVLAGLIIGGGALWGAFTSADRDAQGIIADSGSLNADELQVGDCLDWPGSSDDVVEQFDSVDAHPCTEPHDLEVFATVEYPSAQGVPYPGDDWITEFGFGECLMSFQPYIGAAYDAVPDIDITIFWPSEESWDEDDRTIHCLLVPTSEGVKLFDSLQGREA